MIPQYIFSRKKFHKILLDPPDFAPGSWRGAGKLIIDYENKEYWLTSRPRVREKRGYGIEIFKSTNGEDFSLVNFVPIEDVSKQMNIALHSIENTQILLDPLTNKYYLYASVDTGKQWKTILLISDDPKGEWKYYGIPINNDKEYDSAEARDCTIDIVDGLYLALCKARTINSHTVFTELLVSKDGISWKKLGIPTIEGKHQNPNPAFLLNGNIYPSTYGPMFIGTITTFYKNAHITKYFGAYIIDLRNNDLQEVFVAEWKKSSAFEREDYPIHTYSNVVYDEFNERWDILIEAIDPTYTEDLGVNTEVDRVLMYVAKMEKRKNI